MVNQELQKTQYNAIIILRLLIGWHFLYEGAIKLFNPNWTAKGYMLSAEGFAKPVFAWLGTDSLIGTVDFLNILCLVLVGLTLLLGIWERLGALVGIGLLLLYYLAHPAFPGLDQAGTEGSYFIVNKNLIEAAALYVIYLIPTASYFGLGRLLKPGLTNSIAST
ncbi:MAG: DoxX family membrane protein [Saprospiraceae bacterium]|nr:DoxX family membrane protein [Saprospiraceae bacterium]